MHMKGPFRFGLRMALLAGILLWLSHPTPGLWPLAWVALFPLIASVQQAKSWQQAAKRGYLFAWVYLAPTWYWTGLTIVGWTGSQVGWSALFLVTLLGALFYATWAGLAWWISRRTAGVWRMISIAALWTVMEWTRTVGWFSFPWAQVAYSQYKFLPLIQLAEVTGALGVTFVVLLFNAALAEWWQHRTQFQSQRWMSSMITLVGMLCLIGFARMAQLSEGKPVQVAVMQGNFNYQNGENVPLKMQTFETLTRAAHQTSTPPPDLYVWAESAAPKDPLHYLPSKEMLQGLADTYKAGLLTGAYIQGANNEESNTALLFQPGATEPQRFDKVGLVPFGEYIPYRNLFPREIQERFNFFETDVKPGSALNPMTLTTSAGTVSIGPFICYESVYPHYTRTMTHNGAQLLITPSHDQWFRSEAAMEQHLAIVIFRAVENRRDVARATTDGVSALIDARGHILARAPLYQACFLVRQLHLRSLITVYNRFGDWFIGLCVLLLVMAIMETRWHPWLDSLSGHKPKRVRD